MMRSPGSRACSFSACLGSSDYAGSRGGLALCPCSFRLPFQSTRSASRLKFLEAQYPAHRYLCLRFGCRLATTTAKLEAKMACYSFLVGLFHSLLHAGLSRRTARHHFSTGWLLRRQLKFRRNVVLRIQIVLTKRVHGIRHLHPL